MWVDLIDRDSVHPMPSSKRLIPRFELNPRGEGVDRTIFASTRMPQSRTSPTPSHASAAREGRW